MSELCEEYKIQPSVFYSWQRQLFDNLQTTMDAVGGRKRGGPEEALKKRVEGLEAELTKKLESARQARRERRQEGRRAA